MNYVFRNGQLLSKYDTRDYWMNGLEEPVFSNDSYMYDTVHRSWYTTMGCIDALRVPAENRTALLILM